MAQINYAPDLHELWEEAQRLEAELQTLRARLEAGLAAPLALFSPADVIAAPWDVAPYCWAIKAGRLVRAEAVKVQKQVRERCVNRSIERYNRQSQLVWRDTSHDETSLRLI